MKKRSINIFGSTSDSGASKQSRSKKKSEAERQRLADKEALGKAALDKLNPMVIPLLAAQQNQSGFVIASIDVIQNRPERLTENWINKLNKWVDDVAAAAILEEPDIEIGQRAEFGPIMVDKIIPPKMDVEFPMPAIMCKDERGWKWYFKTSKASDFAAGDYITFSATPSGHGEGITFLRRPTKLKKVLIVLEEDND